MTHRLGLVANIWSKKAGWLRELRRAGVLDLFEADDAAELALALAAAAHIEAQRDIAELVEHAGGLHHVL